MNLTTAVVQFAPTTDQAANLRVITELVDEAARRGATLVVLPEYATFTAPQLDDSFVAAAEPLDGPAVELLRNLSARHGLTLIAGVAEPAGNDRIYNTLVGLQHGELIATYRKLHLYDAFGVQESRWVQPGDHAAPQLLTVGEFTIGMQTCYDLRFPEVSRYLVDAGANVLALPAEWVPGPAKIDHWMMLLRARAIENTAYVVAADQAAPTGVGHSVIIDPTGVVIAGVDDGRGTATGVLVAQLLQETRATNPVLSQRRFAVQPEG